MRKVALREVAVILLLVILPSQTNLLNESHATSGPLVDSVTFRIYSSPNDALQAFLRGEVDLVPLDVSSETLAQLKSDSRVKILSIPNFGFTYIGMNLRYAPFNNSAFRQAMLFAFNRDRMLNEQLQGFGEILGAGLFSSAYAKLGWQSTDVPAFGYDVGKAKQLLDRAGYVLPAGSNLRIDPKTKKPLETLFIYSRLGSPMEVASAEEFARDMQAIGLPVFHAPQSAFDFDTLVRQNYLFDLYIDSQPANSAPTWLYDLFASENDVAPVPLGTNLVGYRSGEFDSCAKQLLTSASVDDSRNAALKCQEQLAQDLPVIPLYSKDLLLATNPSLSGLVPIVGSIPATIRQSALSVKEGKDFGGELRVGVAADFADLNPTSSASTSDWLILNLLAEPLLTLDQDGKPAAGLAERWSVGDGGNTVSFTLREGARFRSGEQVRAQDIAATVNWLRGNIKSSSPLFSTIEIIEKAEALDERTLKVTLKEANGFAVNSVGQLFALPERTLRELPATSSFLNSRILVSSGPFTLAELKQGESATLRYNDLYYDAPPEHRLATERVEAAQGELLLGVRVTGGSQISIESKSVTYRGQAVENANFTIFVLSADGSQVLAIPGSHKGSGVYVATFSADNPSLKPGNYRVETHVYGELPSGRLLELDERSLIIKAATPIVLITLIVAVIAVAAVATLILVRKHRPKPATSSTPSFI